MKKSLKERQIEVLTCDVEKWNRYMRYCRSQKYDFYADLRSANLSYADLLYADLSYADLRYADLLYADLRSANLSHADLLYADLSYADLRYADLLYADLLYANLSHADLSYADLLYANLSHADLSYADLRSANLDFSALPLWCGSLKIKTDTKQRKQIAYHLASLFVNSEGILTDEEKQLLEAIKPFANQFHRVSECGKL